MTFRDGISTQLQENINSILILTFSMFFTLKLMVNGKKNLGRV